MALVVMISSSQALAHLRGTMAQTHKAALYNMLKASGQPVEKRYIHYTVDELEAALKKAGIDVSALPVDESTPAEHEGIEQRNTADPNELPGQRDNIKHPDEPIRVDDKGRIWLQEEVRKPAYPKPRGRRVLKYLETGSTTETVQNGDYIETFEVAGTQASRPAEVKITLPSYQVGIYRDPRFPFKIHCYNEREGFDLFDVQEFYGGAELVPAGVKRVYIENELCYDIRSVVQAIQAEHRQLMLTRRI